LAPDYSLAHSNLLLGLHYINEDPQSLAEEHRAWARQHAPAAPPVQFTNSREPDRRLRIGYISPDLYEHVVARFILPAFLHHDRAQFDIFAYGDITKPDHITQRIA